MLIQLDSIAAISNTEFCDNRANGSGGVLIIILLTNVTIESSMFLRNSADRGGVIHIADASQLLERECMYEKNMAVLGGVASMMVKVYITTIEQKLEVLSMLLDLNFFLLILHFPITRC